MTTKQLNQKAFQYILDCISGEGYEKEFNTDSERLQFLADCFNGEYVCEFNLKRDGSYQSMFKNWIQGAPSCFNIAYEYHEIIALAKEWGSIPKNATDKEENKILSNYFNFIASKTFQLMKKYNVLPYSNKSIGTMMLQSIRHPLLYPSLVCQFLATCRE